MKTRDITYIAVSAALIAVCSWISIPSAVPFTLQTFGVFLTVGVLGGKRGFFAVLVYILIGAAGAPVFSGFSGGLGVLIGATGGYIAGFLLSAAIIWLITHFFGEKTVVLAIGMFVGLIACYTIGTAWFMIVYLRTTGAVQLIAVLTKCVFPFIIPDIVKIYAALYLTKRLKKLIP